MQSIETKLTIFKSSGGMLANTMGAPAQANNWTVQGGVAPIAALIRTVAPTTKNPRVYYGSKYAYPNAAPMPTVAPIPTTDATTMSVPIPAAAELQVIFCGFVLRLL